MIVNFAAKRGGDGVADGIGICVRGVKQCFGAQGVVEGALAENLGKEAAVIAELSIGSDY